MLKKKTVKKTCKSSVRKKSGGWSLFGKKKSNKKDYAYKVTYKINGEKKYANVWVGDKSEALSEFKRRNPKATNIKATRFVSPKSKLFG